MYRQAISINNWNKKMTRKKKKKRFSYETDAFIGRGKTNFKKIKCKKNILKSQFFSVSQKYSKKSILWFSLYKIIIIYYFNILCQFIKYFTISFFKQDVLFTLFKRSG